MQKAKENDLQTF